MEDKKLTREDKIIEILYEEPGGLTVQNIADNLKISTVTAAKDLEILVALKKIYRREVGSAKIHYHLKWARSFKYIT